MKLSFICRVIGHRYDYVDPRQGTASAMLCRRCKHILPALNRVIPLTKAPTKQATRIDGKSL